MLVIIDAKPKDLGLPTEAYVAVEEVHDVSISCHFNLKLNVMVLQYKVYRLCVVFRMVPQLAKRSNMFPVKLGQKKRKKLVLNTCYGIKLSYSITFQSIIFQNIISF